MLVEFPHVKQEAGPNRRRWFQGEGMELIIWYGAGEAPEGFQICYQGPDRRERALTWRAGRGFTHAQVDGGDSRPDKDLTPILVKDGAVPWELVQGEFEQRSTGLEPALRNYVLGALQGRAG